MLPALGLMAAGKPVVHQRIEIGISHRINMAAAPPIAAVGSAELFELLVAKRDTTGATVAGGNVDKGFVNELHSGILKKTTPRLVGALS